MKCSLINLCNANTVPEIFAPAQLWRQLVENIEMQLSPVYFSIDKKSPCFYQNSYLHMYTESIDDHQNYMLVHETPS